MCIHWFRLKYEIKKNAIEKINCDFLTRIAASFCGCFHCCNCDSLWRMHCICVSMKTLVLHVLLAWFARKVSDTKSEPILQLDMRRRDQRKCEATRDRTQHFISNLFLRIAFLNCKFLNSICLQYAKYNGIRITYVCMYNAQTPWMPPYDEM